MGIKISELNPLETPADGDIIPIVDMDAGETKYIEFADLLGPEGPAGPAGADGEEVTIRVDGGYIQWRLGDGEWENLIAVSSLVGPQGEQGIQGPAGPAATLNWMGAWSALTEYDPLDVVSHEGVTYICIATSTDDEPPDPVHWNAIGAASRGAISAEVAYDDADGEVTLLTMPGNGFIRFVGKVVTTAYDDGSVTLGKEGDESCLMSAALVDAQGATNDTYTPNKYYASGAVIKAFITPHSEIDLYTTPEIVGNAASGGISSRASKVFGPIDCSGLTKANGTLSIDVKYVGDALNRCTLEITSSGAYDNEEWSTEILPQIIQDGDYHTYEFPLATWSTIGGEMDPSEIDYIRIYGRSESGDAQFWWKNAKIRMNTSEGVFTLILEYMTV